MKIASLVFLILFGVSSLVHLYFCFKEKERYRFITKPFCLSFLTLAAIFYAPTEPLIYIGALFGLGGDVFLLKKHNKVAFFIGMLLFIGGHILYLFALLKGFNSLTWISYLVFGISLLVVGAIFYFFTRKLAGPLTAIVGSLYMALLLCLLGFGVAASIVHETHRISGILFALGYTSFFTSDMILVMTKFVKDIKRRDFYIMIFYLLAETLIVVGLCLLLG